MLVVVAAAPCFALDVNIDGSILDSGGPKIVSENLNRTFRLRKASDFVLLAKQAKVFKNNVFLIRYSSNQQGHARLGIAVSKKRVKLAVKRNRIKRIIRETFRRYCLRLPDRDYMISYRGVQDRNDVLTLHEKLIRFWQQEVI